MQSASSGLLQDATSIADAPGKGQTLQVVAQRHARCCPRMVLAEDVFVALAWLGVGIGYAAAVVKLARMARAPERDAKIAIETGSSPGARVPHEDELDALSARTAGRRRIRGSAALARRRRC
jgi:hypothetical protein